ncbi:MAG TPA: MBL fold metallo-hydrolase [Candidatus Baltobacteraceae bacterium]|nr:MBL fold metallo-hydrolase [Candidatus Baltobacteraceae bacterium]
MPTRLTILVENTVPGKSDGLYAEHGFAVFIERPETRLLFDTGPQGIALLHNAPRLGIDLHTTDAIVLSHGHGDHTGGLAAVLSVLGKSVPVYGHPDIFLQRYGKRRGGEIRYAGLPFAQAALEGNGARFDLSPEFRAIAPGVYVTGEVPRRRAFETGDARLFVRKNGQEEPDPFSDDQSVVLETPEGLVLLLGCCHAGLINTIDHVQSQLPGRPIHTVVGGTHLGFAPPDQLQQTIETLRALDIKRLGVSHCTGLQAGARLAAALGDRVAFCNVGSSLVFN